MGVPKQMYNHVADGSGDFPPTIGDGASDVEDALIAPSEAGSSAPVSRDVSPFPPAPILAAPRRRVRPNRNLSKPIDVRGLSDRRVGVRAVRRKQNNQFLLTLIEEEEEGLPELRERSGETPFTKLFTEEKSMMAWSDFISMSEERQREYLERLDERDEDADISGSSSSGDGDWELLDGPSVSSPDASSQDDSSRDARRLHPASESTTAAEVAFASPEACFQRVEMRFRGMLQKRHFPLGILASLEEDLTEFFSECPRSVWVSRLSSSYERLLLHALCQYLDLKSSSFDRAKARHTQVENQNLAFSPPKKTLCQHLEDMKKMKSQKKETITSHEE